MLATAVNTVNYLHSSRLVVLKSTISCPGHGVVRRIWPMWRWHAHIATLVNGRISMGKSHIGSADGTIQSPDAAVGGAFSMVSAALV